MESIARNVLVGALLVASSVSARATDDAWNATFDALPRFASESQPLVEPTGLILSTTPRSKTLFGGVIGRNLGSSPLDIDRHRFEGLGSERLGWTVGSSLEPDTTNPGLMANQYFDFQSSSRFTPTIGGGIGVANAPGGTPGSLSYSGGSEDYQVFMFRFEAALGYEFSDSVRGSVGYRLLGSGQNDLSDTLSVPLSSDWEQDQALEIGVRIDF